MINKTLLVDSPNIFKRAYYGAKHIYNSKGQSIGGLFSFYMSLRKVIKEQSINKVILCWDGNNSGKLKYNLYEHYKANRESKDWYKKVVLTEKQIKKETEDASILYQQQRIKEYAEHLHLRQVEVDYIEADDVIGYYAKNYHTEEEIYIFSTDQDYLQLLQFDNVHIYEPRKKIVIDNDNFFLHYDFHYENALLLKILCGDKGDNIEGIDSCGEKGLLKNFPQLKDVKLTINDIKEQAKKILEDRVATKKKPLKLLKNILDGRTKSGIKGDDLFEINKKIMDLANPILNKMVTSEIHQVKDYSLDLEGRKSEFLLKLMHEDEFFKNWNMPEAEFFKPFYPIILREKKLSN